MNALVLACAVLLVPSIGCAQGETVKRDNELQRRMDVLVNKLSGREVGTVEILQISPDTQTRVRVTPEALEKQYEYKLSIREIRGRPLEEGFVRAMKSVAVEGDSGIPDLRWGILFFGSDGARIGAVYLDRTGQRGVVGNATVLLKGDLLPWLKKSVGTCFR